MRLFLGLPVPAALALDIDTWRQRNLACDGRPVPAANFHITLGFIGEVAQGSLESLLLTIDERLAHKPGQSGALLLDELGFWPGPGIYWLGPREWPASLTRLAESLRQVAASVGRRRDRKAFRPHITLYRGCVAPPAASLAAPAQRLHYDELCLYESRRTGEGVRYEVLESWSLGQARQVVQPR